MPTIVIQTLLAVISQIAPAASANLIASIINALTVLIPVLIKEYNALVPTVKSIIATLKGNPEATDEQLDALDKLDADADAAFEAAAAAAQAEDDANK